MMKTIGFLGCGNMGGAIARAVCKATEPENVFLARPKRWPQSWAVRQPPTPRLPVTAT